MNVTKILDFELVLGLSAVKNGGADSDQYLKYLIHFNLRCFSIGSFLNQET